MGAVCDTFAVHASGIRSPLWCKVDIHPSNWSAIITGCHDVDYAGLFHCGGELFVGREYIDHLLAFTAHDHCFVHALVEEKVSWIYYLVSVIGLIGITVLTRPNRSLDVTGVILALAMGVSFSLYLVMTCMLRDEFTITNLFYTAIGVLIPLSTKLSAFWKPLTLQSGSMMVLVGLLGFVLLWLLDKALEMTSAAVTAPFLYSEMLWLVVFKLITRIF